MDSHPKPSVFCYSYQLRSLKCEGVLASLYQRRKIQNSIGSDYYSHLGTAWIHRAQYNSNADQSRSDSAFVRRSARLDSRDSWRIDDYRAALLRGYACPRCSTSVKASRSYEIMHVCCVFIHVCSAQQPSLRHRQCSFRTTRRHEARPVTQPQLNGITRPVCT